MARIDIVEQAGGSFRDAGLAVSEWELRKAPHQDAGYGLLGAGDLAELERHLVGLDPMDRHARFGSALSDSAVAAYVRRIDPARAVLFGALDDDGCILGIGEAQPTLAPRRVELAVSVHAPYRRHGLGRRLVEAAMTAAFARGADAAELHFDRGNIPMIGLVRSFGVRIVLGGMCRAEIRRGGSRTCLHVWPPLPARAAACVPDGGHDRGHDDTAASLSRHMMPAT